MLITHLLVLTMALNLSGLSGNAGLQWNTPAPSPLAGLNSSYKPLNLTQAFQSGGLKLNYVPQNSSLQKYQGQTLGLTNSSQPSAPSGPSIGGSNWRGDAINAGLDVNAPQFAGLRAQDEAGAFGQVDSAYGEANSIYNSMYNDAVNGKQNYLDSLSKPYDAQRPLLDNARTGALNLNQSQVDQTYQQNESALAAARRLYNELSQGVQQRFGGTNSAGEFANTFYGREFQRQQGNVQQTTGQNIKGLMEQQTSIENDYQAKLQSLEQQKQAALAQAQVEFQNRLDQINQARGQLAQNKAGLKLQALQELKQRSYQIQDDQRKYAQQLEAQAKAQASQIQSAIGQYSQQYSTPVQTQAYAPATYSQIGGGQTSASNPLSSLTGYVPSSQRKEDPYSYTG